MKMTNTKDIVNVVITSDLMCPWCWVGLRKLQEASKNAQLDMRITWKPFLLRPNMPEEGVLKSDPTPNSRVGHRLRQAGQQVGIHFTGLTDRTPNTTLFHAVMDLFQEELHVDARLVTAFHEAAFEGYFTLGEFPDQTGLLKAARRVQQQQPHRGAALLVEHMEAFFQDKEKVEATKKHVRDQSFEASRRGISSVPTFEFNEENVFSGAQPVATFEVLLSAAVDSGRAW